MQGSFANPAAYPIPRQEKWGRGSSLEVEPDQFKFGRALELANSKDAAAGWIRHAAVSSTMTMGAELKPVGTEAE